MFNILRRIAARPRLIYHSLAAQVSGLSDLSVNAQCQTPDPNYETMLANLVAQRGKSYVIMDNLRMAQDLQWWLSGSAVVARLNPPGGMDGMSQTMNPQQVVLHYEPLWGTDIYGYVGNENGGGPEYVRWTIDVIKEARKVGLKVCVFNIAVGQPHQDRIRAGEYDELLTLIQDDPNVILAFHEGGYNQDDPMEGNWDPVQQMYLYSGRLLLMYERTEEIGNKPFYSMCSEWTMDLPGRGIKWFLDKWTGEGKDAEKHLFDMVVRAHEKLYARLGKYFLGLCWYCYGQATAEWWPYNIYLHGKRFLAMCAGYRSPVVEPEPELPKEPEPMKGQYIINGLAGRLNVRGVPGGPVIATLGNGDVITLTGNHTDAVLDRKVYLWRETTIGWIAVVPELVLEEYVPPVSDVSEIILAALEDISVAVSQISDVIPKVGEAMGPLNSATEKLASIVLSEIGESA